MKTIVSPGSAEIARYTCDITGDPLPYRPPVVIMIRCGFGSEYDGDTFDLHVSEKASKVILPLLRSLLLNGDSLEPHRTESLFNRGSLEEKRIAKGEDRKLLQKLRILRRRRKRNRTRMIKESLVAKTEETHCSDSSARRKIRERLLKQRLNPFDHKT